MHVHGDTADLYLPIAKIVPRGLLYLVLAILELGP